MLWRLSSILCLVMLVFLLPRLAEAVDTVTVDFGGTPTVLSINAANKTLLTRMMTQENARRAAKSPPLAALTLADFVRDLIVDMVRGYKVQTAGQDHVDACTTFKALSAGAQATLVTQFGGTSPCP